MLALYIFGAIALLVIVVLGMHATYRRYVVNPEALPPHFKRHTYPNGVEVYFHQGGPAAFFEVPFICRDMSKLRASDEWKLVSEYCTGNGNVIPETDEFKQKLERFSKRCQKFADSHSGRIHPSVYMDAPYAYVRERYAPKKAGNAQCAQEESVMFS